MGRSGGADGTCSTNGHAGNTGHFTAYGLLQWRRPIDKCSTPWILYLSYDPKCFHLLNDRQPFSPDWEPQYYIGRRCRLHSSLLQCVRYRTRLDVMETNAIFGPSSDKLHCSDCPLKLTVLKQVCSTVAHLGLISLSRAPSRHTEHVQGSCP